MPSAGRIALMHIAVVLLVEALSIRRWEQLMHTLADFGMPIR